MAEQPLELVAGKEGPLTGLRGTEVSPQKIPDAADLQRQAHELGEALRVLIVTAKRLPREKALEPHQDPVRSLALAQSHLQTGFMWLRRAIDPPRMF